ncbi:adenylate kinase 9-like [Spodoptera litura]|uniref:Adenylate kinase 9-like n=1 Tax=Spodoptera litura TaxID=69820 RepID=A0A9J7E0V1_SPOLT|nr:adenylate kinase 9-like [Spodoptera litura]
MRHMSIYNFPFALYPKKKFDYLFLFTIMIELEHYKHNLDIIDTYNVKNFKISKGIVYTGDTEYINPKTEVKKHVSPLLGAAMYGLNNTAAPLPEDTKFFDIWSDIDAQEIHLSKKPTCYIIFGKSGSGAYNLGEAMAKKLNVLHLCPKNLLEDELAQESSTGKAWHFNMRNNKVCQFNMILTMLKIKMLSEVVQHRGYVISGLPLVTCRRNPLYCIDSLYSEEAFLQIDEILFDTIRNLNKNKSKARHPKSSPSSKSSEFITGEDQEDYEGQEEEEHLEDLHAEEALEEEDKPVELPIFELNTCSNIIFHEKPYIKSKQAVIFQQLQELFNLPLKPDILLQINCPEMDLVKMRSYRYLNYKTGQNAIEPFVSNYVQEQTWPDEYTMHDYEIPHENYMFHPKYNCKPPANFEKKVIEQVCSYRTYVFPYLEKKFKEFDPKMIIQLDGRMPCGKMLHNIMERLILLPTQPVITPTPFSDAAPEDMEDFWASIEESNVIRSDIVNFKYSPSPWFNRCPVELKLRRTVPGLTKYAVYYLKHVYLLSSRNNFISFIRNPRPYLKIKYLEPTCRIIILGTKSSGKTMVANCLSWLFDAPILDFQTILNKEKDKIYITVAQPILSEIITTIEDARLLKWQADESERLEQFNNWCEYTSQLLEQYLPLLVKKTKYEKIKAYRLAKKEKELKEYYELSEELKEEIEQEEEEEVVSDVEYMDEEMNLDFFEEFDDLRTQLSFLPILDSVLECESTLDGQNISQYAPTELNTETKKPSIPVLGDEDVTTAISNYIAANELESSLEPTAEQVINEINKLLTEIDNQCAEKTQSEELYGKYILDGFSPDPEYWSYLNDKVFPDYTITLIENREIDEKLCEYYSQSDSHNKHYNATIFSAKDPLLQTKQRAINISRLEQADIKIILYNLVDDVVGAEIMPHIEIESESDFIASFTEAIEKFRENWDSAKVNIEDRSKVYIEIELNNKTDVEIIEETLMKLRQCYRPTVQTQEDQEVDEPTDEDEIDVPPKDLLTYNDSQFLCETNIYCPVAYFKYGILWEGKPEFSLKYDNKMHYFCKEEFLEIFSKDVTEYQYYNNPFKKIPKLKICVTGPVGCGTTSVSRFIAKELGLLHIDYVHFLTEYLMPKHFKKVGFKNENMFTDEVIDDEGVVEFQVDEEGENQSTDVLWNEKEMLRMLNNHFERGGSILPILMQKMIQKIWHDPSMNMGFVLDGYPKLANDIEDMMTHYGIPDMVIDLQSSVEVSFDRLGPGMFKKWKEQQNEAKKKAAVKLDNERKQWMHNITKEIVVKLLIEEIFDTMFAFKSEQGLNVHSAIMDADPSGDINIDPLLFKLYNEMVQENPEPSDTNVWESNAAARERMQARLEGIYETEDENLQSLKQALLEHKIKTVTIDATKPLQKVIRNALTSLTHLRNRNESFFEQTFIVSLDVAEMLLLRGFYFLSKFNRLCPVYIFENPRAVQNSYKISKVRGTLYAVIHRTYIYYLSNADSVIKFRNNPLKYIIADAVNSYFEYPLRIGIIGTPKSGKSTLAARLSKEFGLICLSRGNSVRSVLEHMHWTELACQMRKALSKGKEIDDNQIVQSVQALAIDHRTETYGYVTDGVPANPYRAQGYVKNGLYPNIIFDICSSKEKCLQNSQNEIYNDILKHMPPYPCPLIEMRYDSWSLRQHRIRDWIAEDYQNLYVLNGTNSKWHVFKQAINHLTQLNNKIHYYVLNVDKTIVHAICISNAAFEERQSQYKTLCPVCFHKKIYKHMGNFFGGKTGVVQYKNKFYWVCSEHMELVMSFPHCYLTDIEIEIPELPAVIDIVNIDYIYENGVCVVTYAENLPAQIINIGTNEFAASYAGKMYLFCSRSCLSKFLCKPYLYNDITIFKEARKFPKLTLKQLPNIGYLEQTLGNMLTEACCSVNVVRPKYPGLSFQTSALIYIALFLKTHNHLTSKNIKEMYIKCLKIFEARCKLMLSVGLRLRSMDNPFATYPKCHHREPTLHPPQQSDPYLSSSLIQTPSLLLQRTSNYVQIHKPSFLTAQKVRSGISSQMERD